MMSVQDIERNPEDPMVIFYDQFVRSVITSTATALRTTMFRYMSPKQQVEVIVNGILTGLVAVALSSVIKDGRDSIVEYIKNSVDPSVHNAAKLLEECHYDDLLKQHMP